MGPAQQMSDSVSQAASVQWPLIRQGKTFPLPKTLGGGWAVHYSCVEGLGFFDWLQGSSIWVCVGIRIR